MILADDTMLVELVRAGHGDARAAFDEIDRRYRPRLTRLLMRHADSRSHVEESVQSVLIQAFEAIPVWGPKEELAPWLYREALRQGRRDVGRSFAGPFFEPQDERHNPARLAENREETDNLWIIARHALKPDEYTAIWLKYVDGLKVETIANIMERTKISVRVLLFRARRKLLPLLQQRNR